MTNPTTTITQKGVLANAMISAVLSTTNPKRSRDFYENKLGLRVNEAREEETVYDGGGGTSLLVYRRGEAPKAVNTACGFNVNDLDKAMGALRKNGIKFEEYDFPGLKTVNGVAEKDGWRSAWLKDPDGNVLAITQM